MSMRTILLMFGMIGMCAYVQAELRTWTLKNGQTFDAEMTRKIFDSLVMVDPAGRELSIPLDSFDLSEDDQEYLMLESPPKLKIEFRKSIQRKNFEMIRGSEDRVPENRATFGAKVNLQDKFDYDGELTVELFAIGGELWGDRYIILDRQTSRFVPSKEEKYTHEFYSKRLVRLTNVLDELKGKDYTRRGERYEGFLVSVKDKRGKIIGIDGSKDWLEEHVEKLEMLKIGNYFDKTCTRTFPTRPKSYMEDNYAGRP